MSSRSVHTRQLGLEEKLMYKSGSSSHHVKIACVSSVISPKPISSIFKFSDLESEHENQGVLTSSSLTKVTSVPNIMTRNNTITENPLDTTQKKLMLSCDDPEKEKPMSCDDP